MKKNIIIYILLAFKLIFSEVYKDRFLIYINNSIGEVEISLANGFTNNKEINNLLEEIGYDEIFQWLPSARPSDRDGEVYLNRFFVIKMPKESDDIFELIKIASKVDNIDSAEPITIMKTNYTPNDPRWNQQYGLELIQADLAFDLWNISDGHLPGSSDAEEIVVAIVDVGFEWTHPDLVNNVWQNLGEDFDGDGAVIVQQGNTWIFDPGDQNGIDDDGDGYVDNFIGWDVSYNDNDPTPESFSHDHGTLVAGCVSASTDNNIGISSVGWSVKLMGINSSDDPEVVSDGYNGVLTAAQMGADVINMSWGGSGGGAQNIMNTVYNSYGCILVASAGNGDEDGNTDFAYHTPSGLDNVISVSAIGPNDNFSCWATGGETVDLCAPGESIITTDVNNDYRAANGTSFASPIAAGAVALLLSYFPDQNQDWIVDRLVSNTDYFSDMDGSCNAGSLSGMLGSGRLNINKALSFDINAKLNITEINYSGDSDGDGIFNPGEQTQVKIIVENEEGWADAENVIATISSADERINIIDSTITFTNTIVSGASSFTLIDHFLVESVDDESLNDILCTVNLQSGASEPYHNVEIDIVLPLSLNQAGFPSENITIKSSPTIADLNVDSSSEIYFGAENESFYGFDETGTILDGFPIDINGGIRSSPAVADLDNNGDKEIVFGSNNGRLTILNSDGSQNNIYQISGGINGSPALYDLDGDMDLEIVFTSDYNSSGMVYAIHHNGEDFENFPVNIGEKMLVGAAIGDLENDGEVDIVVCTWGENIYVLTSEGVIKPGFPFISTKRFNTPATLADLTADGNLEIIAGNDDGNLHVLNFNGQELYSYNTGDDIRGGISVSDINNDGSLELLFTGYDDLLHVWSPIEDSELEGFPINLGERSLSEPVTVDLDNDGDLEIIAVNKDGFLFIFHHDGSMLDLFPIFLPGGVEATPVVSDLDRDGDYEIAVGTTMGLEVIDIKTSKGDLPSWKIHRGNLERTGQMGLVLLSNENSSQLISSEFYISPSYPNPFNPSTSINIKTIEKNILNVSVLDINGRLINILKNENILPGNYKIKWNGTDFNGWNMSSGVYFIKVQSGNNISSQKVLLIK